MTYPHDSARARAQRREVFVGAVVLTLVVGCVGWFVWARSRGAT